MSLSFVPGSRGGVCLEVWGQGSQSSEHQGKQKYQKELKHWWDPLKETEPLSKALN